MSESRAITAEKRRILITGGAGAIGCHVVRELSETHEVMVLDNLSSGSFSYLPSAGVQAMAIDIRDTDKLDAIFQAGKFDLVVHLAAHFANQNSVDFPMSDLNVNIKGTLGLLQRCRAHGAKFIYASSSCVYGQRTGKLSEGLPINDLHTPYAISKYTGELYTKFYAEHFGVSSIILRFFNSFGPYEEPGQYRNVIPNFIARALQGRPLVITGTGEETRDFNYAENTAQAVGLAAKACLHDKQIFDIFNVGTGKETTIYTLAKKIKAITGSASEIRIQGERRSWDQTTSRCADISAISTQLGYDSLINLDEGLSRTVEWFRQSPSIWQ